MFINGINLQYYKVLSVILLLSTYEKMKYLSIHVIWKAKEREWMTDSRLSKL